MWLDTLIFGLLVTFSRGTPVIVPQAAPRQAGDTGVVLTTGLSSGIVEGHVPIRREIRDLKENFPEQFNLFILGLRSFQLSDQSDPESFYEIAGIHGRPYKVWQHAENRPGVKAGYCPHSSTLFLSWHRPYLALFEQTLSRHMHETAARFASPLTDRYIQAAEEFRLPFWDWGLGIEGGTVPEYFTQSIIEVTGTDGLHQTIPNPLHQYDFHSLMPGDFEGKWANINSTVRWPTTNQADGQSQNNLFVQDFEARRRSYRDSLSAAFSFPKDLNSFSRAYIEAVHGNIHYSIGAADPAPGHMWNADYSAFEPLFMLHHCNVDRIFALWQAAHPDQRLKPATSTAGNMFITENTIVDSNTPLLPFYKTADTFWTTNNTWDTAEFGYNYPETQCWKYDSAQACGIAVNATIARMYPSSTRAMLTGGTAVTGTDLGHLLVDQSFIDWNIQVQGFQSNLPATFIVKFFLAGDYSSNSVTEIGAWSALTSEHSHAKAMKNKRTSSLEPDMKGTVVLTPALLDLVAVSKLKSLEENDVVPFLKKKLNWTLQEGNGTVVSRSQLDSITVQIVSGKVRIPDDPTQPLEYNDEWNVHPEITAGTEGATKI